MCHLSVSQVEFGVGVPQAGGTAYIGGIVVSSIRIGVLSCDFVASLRQAGALLTSGEVGYCGVIQPDS
jgi:hypothetical protein